MSSKLDGQMVCQRMLACNVYKRKQIQLFSVVRINVSQSSILLNDEMFSTR